MLLQSGNPFPVEPAWALGNVGLPRIVRGGPLAVGELAGYTRQISLNSPIAGSVRLSGHAWVRWGADEYHLNALSRTEYQAAGIACDLYSRGVALPFSASCQTTKADQDGYIQGCDWSVPVIRGSNELYFHCVVRGDGHPHALTVGVLDMTACRPEAGGPCHTIEVDVPLRYQGGADVPRPDGSLVIYVIEAPSTN